MQAYVDDSAKHAMENGGTGIYINLKDGSKKKMLVKSTGRDPSNFCVEAETLKLAVRTMLEQKN